MKPEQSFDISQKSQLAIDFSSKVCYTEGVMQNKNPGYHRNRTHPLLGPFVLAIVGLSMHSVDLPRSFREQHSTAHNVISMIEKINELHHMNEHNLLIPDHKSIRYREEGRTDRNKNKTRENWAAYEPA